MKHADINVARQLLDCSCEFFNDIRITRAEWDIIPSLRVGSIIFRPFVIQRYIQEYKQRGDGAVYVDIRNIQRTAPFQDKTIWEDFEGKLISAPINARPTPKGNYYRIEYSQLANDNTLAAFRELIAWSVEQVKNAARAQ